MKKFLIVLFCIFVSSNCIAEFKPLFKFKEGTKEFVNEYCPNFNDGKNNCLWDLNTALKNGYKVSNTYKEDKSIIYMLRKANKIAMCKVNTKDASSWCELVY